MSKPLSFICWQDLINPIANDLQFPPIFADFNGLHPLLIQVSNYEVLLDDAVRLNKLAKIVSVDSTFKMWNGHVHVWQLMSRLIPGARQALHMTGTFIKTHT